MSCHCFFPHQLIKWFIALLYFSKLFYSFFSFIPYCFTTNYYLLNFSHLVISVIYAKYILLITIYLRSKCRYNLFRQLPTLCDTKTVITCTSFTIITVTSCPFTNYCWYSLILSSCFRHFLFSLVLVCKCCLWLLIYTSQSY